MRRGRTAPTSGSSGGSPSSRLGYEENRHVRLARGGALLRAYRPSVHRGPGGPLHPDVRDVAVLLRDVELQEHEADGTIGLRYLARAGAREWGLYHDVTGNLERVESAAARVLTAMAAARKGPRWRVRALVGERLPWYDAVDEKDGQRIGLLERPAGAAGPAAQGDRAA
jgi:hypothetical protein